MNASVEDDRSSLNTNGLRIGLVGPCAAGKSTLSARLKVLGYQVKHIAQEHSYVQNMWQRLTNPDVLIYLDVSYENTLQRRRMNWTQAEYQQEIERLQHARQHAHLYIDTNRIDPEEVLRTILEFLSEL